MCSILTAVNREDCQIVSAGDKLTWVHHKMNDYETWIIWIKIELLLSVYLENIGSLCLLDCVTQTSAFRYARSFVLITFAGKTSHLQRQLTSKRTYFIPQCSFIIILLVTKVSSGNIHRKCDYLLIVYIHVFILLLFRMLLRQSPTRNELKSSVRMCIQQNV